MNKNIQKLFTELPGTYDLLNRVLTWGMDPRWRGKAVRQAQKAGGKLWIDLCTGTGDMALTLRKKAPEGTRIVAVDFSLPMVREAVKKQKGARGITFVIADASALPFRDGVFNVATITFATRNLNSSREHLLACFRDFQRILRPDGLFLNLETSQPEWRVLKYFYHWYVSLFVKPVGALVSGSSAGYAYLSQTIPRFLPAGELSKVLYTSGFETVKFKRLFFGIIALHSSFKK